MTISSKARVAIVTGGRGGIGLAINEALIASGYRVIAADISPVGTADQAEGLVHVQADITDDKDVRHLVDVAVAEGELAAVVNCAGILRDLKIGRTPGPEIGHMWQVNVEAMARLCHFAVPHMAAGSAVVNIGSVSCRLGRWSIGASMYAATKSGVETYSRYLACELAGQGIRVNAVVPGLISVPMSEAMREVTGGEEASAHLVPMGRYGRPAEVADAVEFLLSARASYITGTTLVVDGGVTIA